MERVAVFLQRLHSTLLVCARTRHTCAWVVDSLSVKGALLKLSNSSQGPPSPEKLAAETNSLPAWNLGLD